MFKAIGEFLDYRKRQKIQKSDKPFFEFEIVNSDTDGIEVVMDWNEAFIKKLRAKNFPGITDEEVIENYLHMIFEKAYLRNVVREQLRDEDE
jgi:hypothetical protein